jgi:hypothetical protein
MGIRTIYKGGSRFYFDTAKPDIRVPGVTSVVGMLPKPFLQFWNAKMVAELAVDSLPIIEQMAARDRQGAVDYLKGAARRYTKARSDIGSQAHDLFERMIRGERVARVHLDMDPYRFRFAEFLDTVQPELIRAEDIAWSDTHGYAGSFDAILSVRLNEDNEPDPAGEPALVIADWKTSKSTYPDVALQMSAYAHADRIISPTGDSEPMPEFDGACVLHITPEGWEFLPVAIDVIKIDGVEYNVFDVFLSLRHTFTWDRVISRSVLGRPIAQSAASRMVTGTQRRGK